MYHPINTHLPGDTHLVVKEQETCEGCYVFNLSNLLGCAKQNFEDYHQQLGLCGSDARPDGKSVIFVEHIPEGE